MNPTKYVQRARRHGMLIMTSHAWSQLWLRGDHQRVQIEEVLEQICGGIQVGAAFPDQFKLEAKSWPVVFIVRCDDDGSAVVATVLHVHHEKSNLERLNNPTYRRGVQRVKERRR